MKRIAAGVLLLAAVCFGQAWAATCSVSATDVAFGSYDRLSLLPLDSAGTVTVQCTGGGGLLSAENVSYTIRLSAGSSGSFSPRKMASGANLLNYNLYTTTARTTTWGSGSGGTSTVGGNFTLGTCLLVLCSNETESRPHTVYGRVPASQNVPAGSYSDTITVTVTY